MIFEIDIGQLFADSPLPSATDPTFCLVVIPSTDLGLARLAAKAIHERAGVNIDVLIVADSKSLGFIKIINLVAEKYAGDLLLYCAQDAFPGINFLRYAQIYLSNKPSVSLLALNDGKWFGHIASFGLVKLSWTRAIYGVGVFHSGYHSHGADVELSEIARAQDCLGFCPDALLIEVDYSKGRRWKSNESDMRLLELRRSQKYPRQKPIPSDSKEISPHSKNRPSRSPLRVIVYTCNFGGYEKVKEISRVEMGIQYFVFSNDPALRTNTWTVKPIKTNLPLNFRRLSRVPKILAHKLLPPHDISVYLDSSLSLKTEDVQALALEVLGDGDIALYPHFERTCVYDEIEHCKALGLEMPDVCDRFLSFLDSICFPRNAGLFENAFIVRRNTPKVRALNDYWWSLYINGSQRDQFSLMPALKEVGVTPEQIMLGKQFRTSPFLIWEKHAQRFEPEA